MTGAATVPVSGSAEEIHAGLDRLLNSDKFRKAPSLRHLLKYLIEKTIEGQTGQIKESIIAIDVFGRREDFDGRLDNIVRVQAHRLRKLLDGYYAEDGRNERVRFSVPRGTYIPHIDIVDAAPDLHSVALPAIAPAVPPPVPALEPAPSFNRGSLFSAILLGAGILLGAAAASLPQVHRLWLAASAADPAVAEIWTGIFGPGVRTIATYTNPAFLRVAHSRMYLLYRGALTAPPGSEINLAESDTAADRQFLPKGQPLFYGDGWTGTGELLAVNRLTLLGAQLNGALNVIPSRGLNMRDMHGTNVIFLGSPWGNGALARIAASSAPVYTSDNGQIVVRNPDKGAPASYANLIDAQSGEVKAVYTLFSVLPGMDGGRATVSSAGLGTAGTWAGIDFTTSAPGAAHLVRALKAANGGTLPHYFQAVICADLIKGNASNPRLVMVRVVHPATPA